MRNSRFIEEVFVKIQGKQHYLWRAVDQDGEIVDVYLQACRDGAAAKRFFKRLLKSHGGEPRKIVTDKLRSYGVAHRELVPEVIHDASQYANNRAEQSHEPTRVRERGMRKFKSHLCRNPVQSVIDVDLAKFFDSIDHELLLGMWREKINDPKFLRYVQRMFKSGVLATGELTVGNEGVPQGSLCSPILANIFAHTVIDVWLEDVVKSHCTGRVAWFRYADDMVRC